jgi:methionyl-tRNA formyltransferase
MSVTDYTYVVCGRKHWNREIFHNEISRLPGEWHFVGTKDELTLDKLRALQPRYVFFLHWSWIVPIEIFSEFECVNFHMTDLPYGRGGSPLQNLILRGHKDTKVTAHRMTEELDAGDVYLKHEMSLNGTAEQILRRSSSVSAAMIAKIVIDQPTPLPQEGEVIHFRRREPEESSIPNVGSPRHLYDFIRMLDADGYPHAFVRHEGFRYEIRDATMKEGVIEASVRILQDDPTQ